MKLALLAGLLLGLVYCIEAAGIRLTGQALVDHINGQNLSYKLKLNKRFAAMSQEELDKRISRKPDPKFLISAPKSSAKASVKSDKPITAIPLNFDIAEKWPQCNKVFRRIKDHGTCPNSGWALLGAAVLTDRRCIISNAKLTTPISAWDAFTCYDIGIPKTIEARCYTHVTLPGWVYENYGGEGIVTGGTFGGFGCKTFPINDQTDVNSLNFTCVQKCREGYTRRSYKNDKQKGPAYNGRFIEQNPESFKREIMEYGSISSFFAVDSTDIFHYSSGVYDYTGEGDENMAIIFGRITGFGVENGVPYWKVATTLGYDFGERGFFKYIDREGPYTTLGVEAPLV